MQINHVLVPYLKKKIKKKRKTTCRNLLSGFTVYVWKGPTTVSQLRRIGHRVCIKTGWHVYKKYVVYWLSDLLCPFGVRFENNRNSFQLLWYVIFALQKQLWYKTVSCPGTFDQTTLTKWKENGICNEKCAIWNRKLTHVLCRPHKYIDFIIPGKYSFSVTTDLAFSNPSTNTNIP